MASSRALVWRLCVPPSVAARASVAVRATLFHTSCAVRLQPLVWQCVRNAIDFGFCGSKPRTISAHSIRAARILATSVTRSIPIAQKNDKRGANRSTESPAARPVRR